MAGLILGGAGLKAASEIQAGRTARAEGSTAFKFALFNQQVQEREAQAIEQKAAFDSLRQEKRARKIRGSLRTELAASGAVLGEGVTADLEQEQLAELELENMLIGFEGRKGAARAREKGKLDVLRGLQAKRRGKAAERASRIKAGTTLLTGFSSPLNTFLSGTA